MFNELDELELQELLEERDELLEELEEGVDSIREIEILYELDNIQESIDLII